jgi:hypothetical protein
MSLKASWVSRLVSNQLVNWKKHLLSISFLYFSGTTQALATYVNIGTIKHLIIKIFPKK